MVALKYMVQEREGKENLNKWGQKGFDWSFWIVKQGKLIEKRKLFLPGSKKKKENFWGSFWIGKGKKEREKEPDIYTPIMIDFLSFSLTFLGTT